MQIAEAEIKENADGNMISAYRLSDNSVSVRVSPNNYFAAFFLLTFFAGFFVYLEKDVFAVIACITAFIFIPLSAFNDKIVFDGKNLYRTGFFYNIFADLRLHKKRLKPAQIEQIETQSLRAVKRGGNIFYRYRTSVQGDNLRFVFASGGEDYRRMIEKLFYSVSKDLLDNRSLELRDYLAEPREVLMKAEFSGIPSAEVLENSAEDFRLKVNRKLSDGELDPGISGKAEELRILGNELWLCGNLIQALEAFRRALHLNPRDPRLIYEFGRCLYSYASVERNQKLLRRAGAALRLACGKANFNADLAARIGETFFQYGDLKRASKCFHKSLEISENFRAARGLGEIALREGKLAHVILHFGNAFRFAQNAALKKWADKESGYFSQLNYDEDYMDLEIRRIKRLETIEKGKTTALKIGLAGILVTAAGLIFDNTIADFGWTISTAAFMFWIVFSLWRTFLIKRNPIAEIED